MLKNGTARSRNSGRENRDERRGRWLFVLGSLWCFGSALIVWGPVKAATAMGIGETLILVANGLLGTAPSGDKKHILSAALQVSTFLEFATVVVFGFALSTTAYSVYSWREQRHIFTLQGFVLSANGLPAKDAVVTLNAGRFVRSTVAPYGRFAFDKIRLDLEPDTKVTITAALKKNTGMTTVDLAAGRNQFLQIKLSSYDDRVRIHYFQLWGHGLDFLAKGDVDPRWEKALSGNPFVVKNETFNYLTYLIENFSAPFDDAYFYLGASYDFPFEDVAKRYSGKAMFLGGERQRHWSWDASLRDVRSVQEAPSSWNLESWDPSQLRKVPLRVGNRDLPVDPESFFFWRFARSEDFNTYPQNPVSRLYSFLTREYLPNDFAVVFLRYQGCGSSTVEGIVPRDIKLLVAAFENVGKDPIRIGDTVARTQSRSSGLRDADTAHKLVRNQQPEMRNIFPPEILGPGEKIVFPLELSADWDGTALPPRRTRAEVETELQDISEVFLPYSSFDILSISKSAFLDLADKARPAITQSYVFGPSYEIDSIEVDGAGMPFRRFDPKNVVIRSGTPEGSCPYVFTYSSSEREWISEGHILYGVNRREKESTSAIRLHRFDGQIVIRELEPEISYIDSVSVLAQCVDGSKQLLHPEDEVLRRGDGRYAILKQGNELKVTFDAPRSGLCNGPYTLITKGFYVTR
jgi:hypothetical protein